MKKKWKGVGRSMVDLTFGWVIDFGLERIDLDKHASIMTSEPIVFVPGLENMPNRYIEFCNYLAFGNRFVRIIAVTDFRLHAG